MAIYSIGGRGVVSGPTSGNSGLQRDLSIPHLQRKQFNKEDFKGEVPTAKPPLLGPPQPPLKSVAGGIGLTEPDWDNWRQVPTRAAREDRAENMRQNKNLRNHGSIYPKSLMDTDTV